jgi:hypothetical protein
MATYTLDYFKLHVLLTRFEHSSRLHKKITTRVHFPEILDMTPFISNARNSTSINSSEKNKKDYQFIPRL